MNVLDLPVEKQREIAKSEGLSYEDWVAQTKKEFEKTSVFLEGVIEREKNATNRDLANERRIYERTLSENPPPGADIVVSS